MPRSSHSQDSGSTSQYTANSLLSSNSDSGFFGSFGTFKSTLELLTFNAGYFLSRDTLKTKIRREVALGAFVVEFLTFLAFCFHPEFPWGDVTAGSLGIASTALQLRLDHWGWNAQQVAWFGAIGVIIFFYTDLILRTLKIIKFRLGFRIQRYLFTLQGPLFIPIISALLQPLACNSDTGFLAGFPDVRCWSSSGSVFAAFSIFFALLWSMTNVFGAVLSTDANPRSMGFAATPHSKAELVIIFSKLCMLIAATFFRANINFRAAVTFLGALACSGTIFMFLPHFNARVNQLRQAMFSMFLWGSICCIAALFAPPSSTDLVMYIFFGACPIFGLLGWFGIWLRAKYSDGRHITLSVKKRSQRNTRASAGSDLSESFAPLHQQQQDSDQSESAAGSRRPSGQPLASGSVTIEPLQKKFFSEHEVELATRFATIRQEYEDEDGNMVEIPVAAEDIVLVRRIYAAGLKQFPKSAFLRLAHAFFLLFAADEEQESRQEFERVCSMFTNPPVTVRYLLFCWRQDLAKKANRADEDDLDIASQLEFTKNFKNARKYHLEAVNNIKALWRALLPKHVDISILPQTMERIHRAETRTDKIFKGMLEKFPKSPRVIRAYAMYVSDVKSKSDIALHYFNRAEQIEEETAQCRRTEFSEQLISGGVAPSDSAQPVDLISGGDLHKQTNANTAALIASLANTTTTPAAVASPTILSAPTSPTHHAELILSLDCEIQSANQEALSLLAHTSPEIQPYLHSSGHNTNGTTSLLDFLSESCAHEFVRHPIAFHEDPQTSHTEWDSFLLFKDAYDASHLTPVHAHSRFLRTESGTHIVVNLTEAHRTRIGCAQTHGLDDETAILVAWDLNVSHTFDISKKAVDTTAIHVVEALPWLPLSTLAVSPLGFCPEVVIHTANQDGESMWLTACGITAADDYINWEFWALSQSPSTHSIRVLNRSLPDHPLPPLPSLPATATGHQQSPQPSADQAATASVALSRGGPGSQASFSTGTGSTSSSRRKARLKKSAMMSGKKKKGTVFVLHRSILMALAAMLFFALASFVTSDQLMTRSQSVVNLTYDAFSLSSLVARVVHSARSVDLGVDVPAAQAEILNHCSVFEDTLLRLFYSDEQNNDQELADSFYLPNITLCPEGFDRQDADTVSACRHGMWAVARTFLFNSRVIGTMANTDPRLVDLQNLNPYVWLTNYGPHRILDNFEDMEWRYTRMSQRALVQIKTILAAVQSLSILVLVFLIFGLIQPSFRRTNKDRFESISLFPLIPKEHIQTLLKRKYFILEEEKGDDESDSDDEVVPDAPSASEQQASHNNGSSGNEPPARTSSSASLSLTFGDRDSPPTEQSGGGQDWTDAPSEDPLCETLHLSTSGRSSSLSPLSPAAPVATSGVRFAEPREDGEKAQSTLRKRKAAAKAKRQLEESGGSDASDTSNSESGSGSGSGDGRDQTTEWRNAKVGRDAKAKAREDDRTEKSNARRDKFDDKESARRDRTLVRAQEESTRAKDEKDREDARLLRMEARNEAKSRRDTRQESGTLRVDERREIEVERIRDELEAEADRKEQLEDEMRFRHERQAADLNREEDNQERDKDQKDTDRMDEVDRKERSKEQKDAKDARRKDRAKQKKQKDTDMMATMESPLVRSLTRRYLLIVVLILFMLVLAIVLGVLAIDNVAVSVVKMKYSSSRSSLAGAMRFFAREHALNGSAILQDDILTRLYLLRKYESALEFGNDELGVQRRQGYQATRDNMLYGHTCFSNCPPKGSLDYVLLASGLSDLVRFYTDQMEIVAQQEHPSLMSDSYKFVQSTGEAAFRVGLQNATALFVEDAIGQLTSSKSSSAAIVAATCFLIFFLYFSSFRPILTYTRDELRRTIQLLLLLPDQVLDIPEINRVLTEKAHEIFDRKEL